MRNDGLMEKEAHYRTKTIDFAKWAILLLYKVLHSLVCACLFFFFCVKGSVHSHHEAVLVVLLFQLLMAVLTKVYSSLNLGNERISELLISQAVASCLAYAAMFCLLHVLNPSAYSFIRWTLSLLLTFVFMLLWTVSGNSLFFRLYPALRTALISGSQESLDIFDIIRLYPKRFNITNRLNVDELLSDLDAIANYDALILNGVSTIHRSIIMKYCLTKDIKTYVRPKLGDILMASSSRTKMLNVSLLSVRTKHQGIGDELIKRSLDALLSSAGLLILSPFMLLIALAIKHEDNGPVFYKQVRLTDGGREFRLIKFRSMRVDAEKDGVARLATENDERITRVGRFLRSTRLDELPQLINILKGEMSLVGPRPERPEIARRYEERFPEFRMRLLCKAGLTGYAQVYGKYGETPYNKLQMDLIYIMNRSFFVDLKLILATMGTILRSDSAEGIREGQVLAQHKHGVDE